MIYLVQQLNIIWFDILSMQLSQQTGHMLLFYQQCIALFLPIASGYQVSHLSDAISVDAKASTQKYIMFYDRQNGENIHQTNTCTHPVTKVYTYT